MGGVRHRGTTHRGHPAQGGWDRRVQAGLVTLAAALVGALAGCSSARPSASSTTPPTRAAPASTAPASTGPPTSPLTAPPTTRWTPAAPQTNPDAAAAALVNAWAGGDRAMAATVAMPQAVAALFAVPYPGADLAISRGCSAGFPPIVCTYGPPGGASPTDSIYEISVAQDPTGWYVTSVNVLA